MQRQTGAAVSGHGAKGFWEREKRGEREGRARERRARENEGGE